MTAAGQRRQKEVIMAFVNTFLSYFVLVLVFAAVAGGGAAIGIYMRKRKDEKTAETLQTGQEP